MVCWGWTNEAEVDRPKSQTAKQLEALSKIARKTGATLDLQDTLDAIVGAVYELIPCSLAEISLWDKEKELLVLRALRCSPDRVFPLGSTYLPGKGYTGWIVEHKKPLWVADITKRTDIQPDLLPGEKPFQSYIGLPLIAGVELIGTLVLVHDEAGAFDRNDMTLVETLMRKALDRVIEVTKDMLRPPSTKPACLNSYPITTRNCLLYIQSPKPSTARLIWRH